MRDAWAPTVVRAVGWELPLLLLLSPLLLFPTPARSLALLALPLLWVGRRMRGGMLVPRTPLDPAILVLVAMVGVSMWVTPDPLVSLPKATGLLLGIALLYALVARAGDRPGVAITVIGLVGAEIGLAIAGLLGTNWSAKLPLISGLTDRLPRLLPALPGGPLEGFNPNSVAGGLVLVIPLLVSLLVYGARREPAIALASAIALLVTGGTMLLSQSRAGYLGLAVGLITLLALSLRRRARIGLLAVGVLLLLLTPTLVDGASLRTDAEGVGAGINSLEERVEIWERARYTIEDFPLTGVGMGMFRRVVPLLYPTFIIAPTKDIGHAHNQILAAGVDLGIPGMVAFLALWIGSGAMCVRCWRAADEPWVRAITLGLGAGLIAHFVWGLVDANVLGSKAGQLFWLALAAVAALHNHVLLQEEGPARG